MTPEEKKAYQRGYHRAAIKAWPEHAPPLPPDELAAKIISVAVDLRNAVNDLLATLDEDDDFEGVLGPKVDAFDQAMVSLGAWVRIAALLPPEPGPTAAKE